MYKYSNIECHIINKNTRILYEQIPKVLIYEFKGNLELLKICCSKRYLSINEISHF